ncbi:MAG TPA: respiratory nitrate reductase subunit gamma [Thermoguttaceae bacterium]|nr:respiratory nitrate reductase subunit gamma [Thermoguttaceae bacterium]
MVSALLAVSYVSLAVFLGAIVCRAVKLARLPIHLRWELYPVAHEKGRASYGGSYLEEPDWWTKPRRSSLAGELKVMIPEILLLAGVWEHNRGHWFRSFPFHFGLYLSAGLVVLLGIGGIAIAAGADVSAAGGAMGRALHHLTYVVGYAALWFGLIGAAALLAKRVFDEDYREYTKKIDFFNLAFFAATFAVAIVAHGLADPRFVALRDYFARLVTFDLSAAGVASASPPGWIAVEIVLASLLLAYIPLTHMSHFFTKWFMYHDVRWSDEPNLPGGEIERQVGRMLQYPVSWSASHIRGDGKKTWAEVAASEVEEKQPS